LSNCSNSGTIDVESIQPVPYYRFGQHVVFQETSPSRAAAVATMGNIEHSIGGACHDALDAIRCLWEVDAIHGDEVVVDVVDVHSACLKVVEVVVCLRASRRIGAWGRGGRGRRGSGWSGRWGWGWSRGGAGQDRGLEVGVLE